MLVKILDRLSWDNCYCTGNFVLQPIDNLVLSPVQNQLQVDLQRKHAELQAIIGQQQQELRRVSEQLLMARLGLLPGSQPQPVVANVSN